MIDQRPFAQPADDQARDALRTFVDQWRAMWGRPPTQDEMDTWTAQAGLPYRIDVSATSRASA